MFVSLKVLCRRKLNHSIHLKKSKTKTHDKNMFMKKILSHLKIEDGITGITVSIYYC